MKESYLLIRPNAHMLDSVCSSGSIQVYCLDMVYVLDPTNTKHPYVFIDLANASFTKDELESLPKTFPEVQFYISSNKTIKLKGFKTITSDEILKPWDIVTKAKGMDFQRRYEFILQHAEEFHGIITILSRNLEHLDLQAIIEFNVIKEVVDNINKKYVSALIAIFIGEWA